MYVTHLRAMPILNARQLHNETSAILDEVSRGKSFQIVRRRRTNDLSGVWSFESIRASLLRHVWCSDRSCNDSSACSRRLAHDCNAAAGGTYADSRGCCADASACCAYEFSIRGSVCTSHDPTHHRGYADCTIDGCRR